MYDNRLHLPDYNLLYALTIILKVFPSLLSPSLAIDGSLARDVGDFDYFFLVTYVDPFKPPPIESVIVLSEHRATGS